MVLWFCGFVVFWFCGIMVLWCYGFRVVWLYSFMFYSFMVYGLMVLGCYGFVFYGFMLLLVLLFLGFKMVSCFFWFYCFLVSKFTKFPFRVFRKRLIPYRRFSRFYADVHHFRCLSFPNLVEQLKCWICKK